jgi:acyl-CoA dehydrogenase
MAELLERARRLGHEVFAPIAERGEPGRLNRPLVRALGDEGLLELVFAGSAVELCELREGLAHGCTEAETALALQGLGGYPILRNPGLRDRWIPRLAAGEAVAAFALSEPDSGSDVASLTLRADGDGDGYRLSGTKVWISNAPEADVYSVFARTSDNGAKGITAFAVPRESDGLSGEHLDLVAPHPIGRLEFDGVRVDADHVLGEVDGGFKVAMETLDLFRPSVGAFGVGMAQAALDAALSHTAGRQAFGRPLSDFQAVSHRLAEIATRVQAARLLVRDAARQYDDGVRPVRKASAMAKLYATEVAQQAVDVAIQVHGALALEKGHLLEHLYREVRAPRIYEGASEVQREIIARELYKEAQ